jgi:hypothetical protein
MHRSATCRGSWSAGGAARTLRIAARTTRALEDRTPALDRAATCTGRCAGTLGYNRPRRRRTVDGAGTCLRHDHSLGGCCRRCSSFRRLRGGRGRGRRRRRGSSGQGRSRRSRRRSCHCSRRWHTRSRRSRTSHYRVGWRRRGDRRALRYRSSGWRGRNRRTRDHGPRRWLRGNGGCLRRRRGHNRRRLARLWHNNAARSRSFDLGSWRCAGRRCRS